MARKKMARINMHLFRSGTRFAVWFAMSFGLLFLVRVPFLLVHFVPYYVPFEPWAALIPLLGVLWGAPAVLAIGAGTALADWMGGLRGALPWYHTVGMMAWAWSARSLWVSPLGKAEKGAPNADTRVEEQERDVEAPTSASPSSGLWFAAFRFMAVAVPGAFLAAVFMALGSDLTRCYPFSYVARISVINYLFYLLVFGVVLYRAFKRHLIPRFGEAKETPDNGARVLFLGAVLQVVGAVGAWTIGHFVAAFLGYPARGPTILGDTVGARLLPGVVPFLILFGIGLFFANPRFMSERPAAPEKPNF